MHKKVLGIVINVFLWVVLAIGISLALLVINTKDEGVSRLFGYVPLNIQSESMDPTIKKGDLIITKEYDGKTLLKKDDIISFKAVEQDTIIIKTHRIIKVIDTNNMVAYVTKGDNAEVIDDVNVAPGDIISVYSGRRIGKLGGVFTFLKSKEGFFIFILVPLFILFIYQLYKFITTIMDVRRK